ncbi:matrix metalloproteinase-25-like protein [Leptotrombidium deliense]|uniref:Matrix metalloproteinase-25-like protein n=1 Tax=Leptotrombidium deliense TaxID=299467 RepID=A0A443SCW7_9ACAR|nr:matrix metalloproteinase-25-like protein [Leptotrombidium deliense]
MLNLLRLYKIARFRNIENSSDLKNITVQLMQILHGCQLIRVSSRSINNRTLIQEVEKAFRIWSDVSKLSFERTQRKDADILISFVSGQHGDDYPFDGDGDVLAHAFFPGEGLGGDVHFDDDEKWVKSKVDDDDGISFFGVAAHEFGHSLGLSHSSVTGSLMFPYYQTIKDDFTLPYDDTVGIQQLYGAKRATKWAPLTPFTPNTSSSTERPRWTNTTRKQSESPVTQRPLPTVPINIPETCNTGIDAISSIRNEIFFFKKNHFWRLNSDLQLERTSASEISLFFYNLPKNFEKIDAVYERPSDGKIVFFIGSEYWLFNLHYPESGYPRPLTTLGFPENIKKIDAAMIWGHNGKTYFFTGHDYWRFDEKKQKVEPDYPRKMDIWKGVPYNVDAAFTWNKNGITYFFKNHLMWSFDNRLMNISEDSPVIATSFWFRSLCKNTTRIPRVRSEESDANSGTELRARVNTRVNVIIYLIYCVLICKFQ